MRYILHKDGSFDLIGRQISLKNCYPGTDGAPLRPIRVETVKNVINYTLAQGTIKVCFIRKIIPGTVPLSELSKRTP